MIYKRKPKDFKPSFEVVSCFFEYDSKMLFLKRLKHKSQGGKWGMPNGKINAGEDRTEALVREILEETGIRVVPEELKFFRSIYVTHEYDFIYHMYHYILPKKMPIRLSATEHEDYIWVPIKQSLDLELVDDLDTCIKMFYPLGDL